MTRQAVVAKKSAATVTKTMSYMGHTSVEGLEPLGLDQRVEQVGKKREQQHAAEDGHVGAPKDGV